MPLLQLHCGVNTTLAASKPCGSTALMAPGTWNLLPALSHFVFICYWNVNRKANKQNPSELQAWLGDSSSHTSREHEEAFPIFRGFISWKTRMVFLQFLGKHAHVPVPGPVILQSIWKWSASITEMQIKREWGFATRCWTEKYAVTPSKCWKATGNDKTKEKM